MKRLCVLAAAVLAASATVAMSAPTAANAADPVRVTIQDWANGDYPTPGSTSDAVFLQPPDMIGNPLSQLWDLDDQGRIISALRGTCLQVEKESKEGEQVYHRECLGETRESWKLVSVPDAPAAVVQIVNEASGRCLEPSEIYVSQYPPLTEETCSPKESAQWFLINKV